MKALLDALSVKPKAYDAAPEEEDSSGLEAAAQEIMDAVQAGDVAQLTAALKSFMEMC